jgi:hypothetical protein
VTWDACCHREAKAITELFLRGVNQEGDVVAMLKRRLRQQTPCAWRANCCCPLIR